MPENTSKEKHPFPIRLSRLMADYNASQQAVADAVGVSRQAVAQWKEGKTVPDMCNFQKLAAYFHVPYEYLLGDTESRTQENVALSDRLGLSDEAIDHLRAVQLMSSLEKGALHPSKSEIVSRIIASDEFDSFIALVQASVLAHCRFEQSLRNEQLADLVAAEQQEEPAYSATGRAVVDMGEMSAFYLYRTQEVLKKIVERISDDCYHEMPL